MLQRLSLPIDSYLAEITDTIRRNLNVILTASPGAGKTTRLPPELLNTVSGRILVLQPRRIAAVAACTRICQERNWRLGEQAGYQVRFESKVSRDTRLIFMTDALLLRRMIEDPELKGIDLVVIDEFHERNLNQDLILGAIKELQDMGRGLKLLIMSATLDTAKLASFLPDANFVDVPGKVFPLDIVYASQSLRPQTDALFYDRLTETVLEACRRASGDVLVFLPGTGEILRTEERIEARISRKIVHLHGSLPLEQQGEVLRPSSQPRVILSTNVAEASVTVPGVDCVVDSGLAKVMSLNTRTGFSSLDLQRISKFNARQRSGRAAREKEGLSFRLWTEHEEVTQPLEPIPECQRVDLSQALLWLANLGVSDFASFAWLDIPSRNLLDFSTQSLRALGAFDGKNCLTELGRRLIQFPLEPRLGVLLALGEKMKAGRLAAQLAAVLSERETGSGESNFRHGQAECDALFRLEFLHERGNRSRQLKTIWETARQLESLLDKDCLGDGVPDPDLIQRLLLLSHVDRLCRRRGTADRAVMMGGRGVRLSPQSSVKKCDFFVALRGVDLPGQADTLISSASGFDKEFVLDVLGDRVSSTEDVHFNEQKGTFWLRRVRRLGDLAIEEPSLSPVSSGAIEGRLAEVLVERWEWLAEKHEGLKDWITRLRFLAQYEERLAAVLTTDIVQQVLDMACAGHTRVDEVLDQDLVALMELVVGREIAKTLKQEAPLHFLAPSGIGHRIQYEEMHSAFVDVRLQEIFGLAESPRIAFGKVPVTFRLLGPNFRPVQVTSDLASFWRSGYPEVRKELRARYPKHSWPEDPMSAKPEAKGRGRKSP